MSWYTEEEQQLLDRIAELEAENARLEALFQQTHGVHHSWVAEGRRLEAENASLRERLREANAWIETRPAIGRNLAEAVAVIEGRTEHHTRETCTCRGCAFLSRQSPAEPKAAPVTCNICKGCSPQFCSKCMGSGVNPAAPVPKPEEPSK